MLKLQELKTEFENDYYKIETDFRHSLVRIKWLPAINDSELKAGALQLHTVVKDTQAENILSDSLHTFSFKPETKEWFASVYYESLNNTKLKKLARVLPTNVFHQITLESIMTRAAATKNLSYQVKSFSSEADAMDWILR